MRLQLNTATLPSTITIDDETAELARVVLSRVPPPGPPGRGPLGHPRPVHSTPELPRDLAYVLGGALSMGLRGSALLSALMAGKRPPWRAPRPTGAEDGPALAAVSVAPEDVQHAAALGARFGLSGEEVSALYPWALRFGLEQLTGGGGAGPFTVGAEIGETLGMPLGDAA